MVMAVIGLLVAIPVTLLIRGGDDETSPPAAGPEPQVELRERALDRRVGVRYRLPREWRARSRDRVLQITSRRRDVAVAISDAGHRSQAQRILRQARAALEDEYRRFEVVTHRVGRRAGDLRADGFVAAARSRRGQDLRILVIVGKGKRRAYLIEVFAPATGPGRGLVEAQALLNALRFDR